MPRGAGRNGEGSGEDRGAALFPRKLGPGEREVIGDAVVEYGEDGLLRACDPHGCSVVRVPRRVLVDVEPVPGIARPRPLTSCIYVEFTDPFMHTGGRGELWFLAPYEVAVDIDDKIIARVTPVKAKFTLVGDIVEGTVCRYYRGPVFAGREEALEARRPGLALVKAVLEGGPAKLPGVGFHAATLPLYTDDEARIYYPVVEVEVEKGFLEVKSSSAPPVKGLRVAQVGRRPLIFLPSLVQPL